MKYLLYISFLFLALSCNEEQRLLDEISGDYTITRVELRQTNDATRDTVISYTDFQLNLANCDWEDNGNGGDCAATATTQDDRTLFLSYQLVDHSGEENDTFSFLEEEGNTEQDEISPEYRLFLGMYKYSLDGNTLTLTTHSDFGIDPKFNSIAYRTQRIIAVRR